MAWCRMSGHTLLSLVEADNHTELRIRKAG
jgi:hypothetical protein